MHLIATKRLSLCLALAAFIAPSAWAQRTEIVEGESLLHNRPQVLTSGVQDMSGFGKNWSANAQLLWRPNKIGDRLDLTLMNPAPGNYKVMGRLTMAPDYGQVRIEINGEQIAGFDPKVRVSDPVQMGPIVITRAIAP